MEKKMIGGKNSKTRILIIVLTVFVFTFSWYGVNGQDCDSPAATMEMSVNNFIATLMTGQDMYTNGQTPGYEIPAGSGVHPIFALDFWVGGVDASGNLMMAGGLGRGAESTDYYSGPLDEGTGLVSEETCGLHDHFSVCYLEDSQNHKLYHDILNAGGDLSVAFPDGYEMPDYFNEYPAHGITEEQAHFLAPFFDYDGDNEYNPEFGDFPLFSEMILETSGNCMGCHGLHGDVAVFWIDNDTGGEHTSTYGAQLGIEIQNVWYAFYEEEGVLSNTSFLQKKIINRGSQILYDFGTSLYADTDLGNPNDDYIGCIKNKNFAFTYNADNMDEAASGTTGYNENPPTLGILMLRGLTDSDGLNLGMNKFMHCSGPGGSPTGTPGLAGDYYNYMRSMWMDGSPLEYGGDGFQEFTYNTSHALSYNNLLSDYGWTELDVEAEFGGPNAPGDRKMVLSSYGVTFEPEMEFCQTFAFIYQEDVSPDPFEDIDALALKADFIQDLFDNCYEDLIVVNVEEVNTELLADVIFDPINKSLQIRSRVDVDLQVINSVGQQIIADKVIHDELISLRTLASGMYIVHLKDNQNRTLSKKIIIE